MKQHFLTYLKNEISAKEKFVSSNELSEADAQAINETIEALKTMVADVEAMEETTDAKEVLKSFKEEIDTKIMALSEKIAEQDKNNDTEEMSQNYLSTKKAVVDFARTVKESKNGIEFTNNWRTVLSENGITDTDGELLPEAIKGAIQDAFERPNSFLSSLNNTGAKAFQVRIADDASEDGEGIRAKGHKKGGTKAAESLVLSHKDIKTQSIYKLMNLSELDVYNDEGALVTYVTTELSERLAYELERAILVGDGRLANSAYKINSVEAIVAADASVYTTSIAYDASTDVLIDKMVDAVSAIKTGNEPVAVMSKATLNSLRRIQFSSDSTVQYVGKEVVAEQIGVSRIYTAEYLGDYTAIVFDPKAYVTVGSNYNGNMYSWIDGYKNEVVYRLETHFGGALGKPFSAAVVAPAD